MFTYVRPISLSQRLLLFMLGIGMFCAALVVLAPAMAQSASEEDMLVEKARFTLENFLSDPDMQWFRDHMKEARGILIVPQFIKGAFFIGGSGGSGVLVVRDEKTNEWSYPAFFTVGGASIGLQFGGQADASVAVGPVGRGIEGSTAPNLSADLLSFSMAKGLFAGFSFEGAAVAARDSLNTAYYKAPTKTIDILVRRNVSNPQADPFLAVVKKAMKGDR